LQAFRHTFFVHVSAACWKVDNFTVPGTLVEWLVPGGMSAREGAMAPASMSAAAAMSVMWMGFMFLDPSAVPNGRQELQ